MFRKRFQLALIHVAVAMTLVPINSTLNRVMIKELAISASLVAILASLPYLFSPTQVMIGAYSDRHPLLGRRRTPYIALGLILCVAGVAFAPQAVFVIPQQPAAGLFLALLAFGAWGMGFNVASVAYLSLASELSGEKGRSRTVAVMWFVMIAGIILTALTLSRLLDTYSPERLKTAFEWVGLAALGLGMLGLVGLEPPASAETPTPAARAGWRRTIGAVLANRDARRFFFYLIVMLAAILGQDVLLEPFAAEAFGMSVRVTTRITSIWGTCVLVALVVANWLERPLGKRRVAQAGAVGAAAGFAVIVASGLLRLESVFFGGLVLLGLATGLATVSNLSLMLDMTTQRVGLFIGAWGVADALARLVGTVLSGVLRDIIGRLTQNNVFGYAGVFIIEAGFLLLSLWMLHHIDVGRFRKQAEPVDWVERASQMGETSS